MFAFVDESGDSGLNLKRGASDFFVLTLVIFTNDDVAQRVESRIIALRRELRFNDDYEFHFSRLKSSFREIFLREVSVFEFFYVSVIFDKRMLIGSTFLGLHKKEAFYKTAYSVLFELARPYLSNATVIIDGSGSREFKRRLASYLKRRINTRNACYISKIRLKDSTTNNLLQLADMICGAIARSHKNEGYSRDYRRFISAREKGVHIWPK